MVASVLNSERAIQVSMVGPAPVGVENFKAVLSFAVRNPEYWAILDDREARRWALSLQCH